MLFSIRSLDTAYFRAVRKEVLLDFTRLRPGLYYVQGRNETDGGRLGSNGAGKSTLFSESVLWTLEGRLSRLKRPGDNVENWSAQGDSTRGSFTFALDDDEHTVTRTRRPNGLKLDGGTVRQEEIDQILPLSDAALRRSIFIDQFGELFFSLEREEKSRLFSEALDLDKWIAAAERAGKAVTNCQRDLDKLTPQLARLEGTIEQASASFEAARVQEDAFEAVLVDEIKAAKAKRRQAAQEAQEARQALDAARDAFAAFSGLVDAHKRLPELRREANLAQRRIEGVERAHMAGGLELDKLTAQQNKYLTGEGDRTCPECGQSITGSHINKRIRELRKQITEVSQARDKLREELPPLDVAYKKLVKEIEDTEAKLPKFNEAQTANAVAAQVSLDADKNHNRAKQAVTDLEQKTNPFTAQCDQLQEQIKKLRRDRKALRQEISDAERLKAICEFWQRGFREIRMEQLDTALVEFEMATNKHAEALGLTNWRVEFATERKTQAGTVSHGFTVFLYAPDTDKPVPFETYSGGESQRWQLAATFGLSEVLLARAGVVTDFEILDEPTTHLSEEGISDLLACLRERAIELNRRIFVIDHNVLDKGSFDGVVTVIKGKNGIIVDDGDLGIVRLKSRERVAL